jgi:glycosyltransferase involved in cell wall biosynthesis
MRICFYAPVQDKSFLKLNQFYWQDILILQSLSDDVVIATTWSEIPWDADVYFIWWWTRAMVPMLKAIPRGKPTIITGTFDLDNPIAGMGYATRPWYKRAALKVALALASTNIFVSELEYNAVPRALTTRNPRYAPHVVETDEYPFVKGPREPFLFTIGWMNGEAVLRKGIDLVIRAHAELLKKRPEIELILAGTPGDATPKMEALAEQMGSRHRVKFVGRIDDAEKIRLLQRCSAYVQASVFEGFGVAAAEAMASGAPVVAYDRAGALPEVLGPHAFYFSERTPAAAADAIERAIDAAGSAAVERAALSIRERFNFERRRRVIRDVLASFGKLPTSAGTI